MNAMSHMNKTALWAVSAMVFFASAGTAGGAAASDWSPSKPVKIIVPLAGGITDVFVRVIAPKLTETLGQPVIVEPKPGAGGNIATDYVAKSAPDGYTLLTGFSGPLAINTTLYDKLPYDPAKDLAPITLVFDVPQFLTIHPSVPARNLAEFIAYAKANPGKLTYASVAFGGGGHLLMEIFKSLASIDLVHAPYKGAGPAVTDLIAGNVQAAFFVTANVQQQMKAGRLRAIGVAGRTRVPSAPDLPTMSEAGFVGMETGAAWLGLLVRAGTPQPIIERYHREIVRIVALPDVRARFDELELNVVASTPAEFSDFMRSETLKWGKVIKQLGLRVN